MKRLEEIKELVNVSILLDEKHICDLIDLIDKHCGNDSLCEFLETLNTGNFSPAEAFVMANNMAKKGRMLDLSKKIGDCVTRASLGDISDSVSLVVMSVLGALDQKVVKVTSPEYGKFSNTFSRLKLIDGFDASISQRKFEKIVAEHNVGFYENTGELVPVDSKLRKIMSKFPEASIPLLTVSLLAKKIALGVSTVVYDVKVGEGGLVKDKQKGYELAKYLVEASKMAGLKVACVVTALNQPVSASVGSMLELREVVKTLSSGNAYFDSDLVAVSREICEVALILMGVADGRIKAGEMFDECIMSGNALLKLQEIVKVFGGDFESISTDLNVLSGVASSYIESEEEGYLADVDSMGLYSACHILNSGIDDSDGDENSGIVMLVREGAKIEIGQKIARLTYSFDNKNFTRALKVASDSFLIKSSAVKHDKLLVKVFV